MKSKVGAIKISIIAIIISLIFYLECQKNFYMCYNILRCVAYVIDVILEKANMTDSYFFYKGKDIYIWLVQGPGEVGRKCIEMISSGVFGSAIVTLIVYYVEYKIQLKDAIHELIKIQRKHVEQLNGLTYISAFLNDENDIKKNAYLEYCNNSHKLREKEKLKQQLKNRKDISEKKKKEILKCNSQRLFQFQHEYAGKYKELIWKNISEEEKEGVMEEVYKNAYLYDKMAGLFFQTDFEIVSAFFDYKDVLEKDILDIERLSEEIYFLGWLTSKKRKKLIKQTWFLNQKYILSIQNILGNSFIIQDFYDYFCGNKDKLLHKIEDLQNEFWNENLTETVAAREYKKWYIRVRKEILKESSEFMEFKKPKNKFEINGSGYALSPDFLRKVRKQNWDYHKYARSDLKKMGYKV